MSTADSVMLRSGMNVPLREYVSSIFAKVLPVCMEGLAPKRLRFHEPDYIAGIVKNIPRMLKNELPPGLTIGGCYIHQSPFASFCHAGKNQCCELGDLLILYREKLGTVEQFNSVLFQFKRADVDRIDSKQYTLYSAWPQFNFGKKIDASREKYDIVPKKTTAGALYNYIHTGANLRFTVADPHRYVMDGGVDVRNGMPFEKYLGQFLSWSAGRKILPHTKHPGEENADQWSHLIWDVVEKTFVAKFSRRNIGIENLPRGFGERLDFLIMNGEMDDSISSTSSDCAVEDGPTENDGACSILFIDNRMDLKPCFVV